MHVDSESCQGYADHVHPVKKDTMTHSERGYVVPDEGYCRALDDETGADKDSALFRETMKATGPQSKKRVDDDLRIETEFFGLVKDKIPRRKRDDPAFMKLAEG